MELFGKISDDQTELRVQQLCARFGIVYRFGFNSGEKWFDINTGEKWFGLFDVPAETATMIMARATLDQYGLKWITSAYPLDMGKEIF